MSVLKYLDPVTGEWKRSNTVKVVNGGAPEQLTAGGYPDYIQPEVLEVVGKVNAVRKDDSIVFVAMSDTHYVADQDLNFYDEETNASAMQSNQAAKVLSYLVKPDFFAHLGDVSCGHGSTTPDMLKKQIEGCVSYVREAASNLPVFVAIGNHDAGIYYHDAQADGNIHTMTGEYLYKNFTALSASDNTVFGGEENGGYCYRDFPDKKLRVLLLNTSEKLVGAQRDSATYGAQRVWLANALLDLNEKEDAAEWGFIILCHYPADYGGTMPLSLLLEAYVNGTSHTISDPASSNAGDGTSRAVSFSGKNTAKMIAQFHGHVHNFKTSKLHSNATGSPVEYDATRVCIPNGQFNRENYYGVVGGIDFAEETSYPKTAGTANGTSFVVNVINRSEEKLYSFCYGAGYDRVVGFGGTVYCTITRSLTNATSNSTTFSVESGESHTEAIYIPEGYDMKSITVTMDGVDITSAAVTIVDGAYRISIPEVTGNVLITAKAQARPNFTNLVPLSIDTDGSDYNVDGDGYDNGVYINSSGSLGNRSASTTTGFIPVSAGAKTIRIAGDGITADSVYTRIAFYDSSFALVGCHPLKNMGIGDYQGVLTEEDSTVLTWTIDSKKMVNQANAPYIRVCTNGNGADLVVTVDEEISYGGAGATNYTVTQSLTRVTSSNAATTVEIGGAFTTTLTANEGYELSSITVKMGGLDVTATAYANGVVSIAQATGNIVITARAKLVLSDDIVNQLAISTDADGNVYNGVGYKADTYLSSSTADAATKTGYYTSGFIPINFGATLYFANCGITEGQTYHRFLFYDAEKSYLPGRAHNTTSGQLGTATTPTYDSEGNMTALTIDSNYWSDAKYVRFCCAYLGEDSIVTVNQPLE